MSRRTEIQVGATLLMAIVILVMGVTWLKEFSLARKVRVWTVSFPQTGGLSSSDEVQVNGLRKGAVSDVALNGDQVIVRLALAQEVALTTDSQVSIRNVGLMGEKVIAVDLRTTGRPYSTRDTIQGIYEKGIPEVMAELGGTIEAVSTIAEQVQALAEAMNRDGNFSETMKNFQLTSIELRDAVRENRATLRQMLGDFSSAARTTKSLTTDREAELRRTLDEFSRAGANMNRLSTRLDSLRASLQAVTDRVGSGQGTLGKLVQDETLYRDVKASIASLNALIADIKKNPKKYLHMSIF